MRSGRNERAAPSRSLPGSSGFTLIELSVVLFVIAIVSGITIPYLRDITGAQLTSTARRLSGTAQYLFEEAAFRSTVYALLIDLDQQSWSVARFDPETGQFVADESLLSRRVVLPPNLRVVDVVVVGIGKVSTGVAPTYFYPEGFADPTVIHLVDARDHAYTIRINPIRGLGEISDGYRDLQSSS